MQKKSRFPMASGVPTPIGCAVNYASKVDRSLLLRDTPSPADFHRPYTGWIGRNFSGGTLLVSHLPGGVREHPDELDLALDAAIDRFVKSPNPTYALLEVSALYAQQSGVGMNTLLAQVLEGLGETRDSVAYLNPCPFRSSDKDVRPDKTRCLDLVVAPVLEAMKPDTVVYLNAAVGGRVEELERRGEWAERGSTKWRYTLSRAIRDDQGLSKDGRERLAIAAAENDNRREVRAAR